MKMLHDLITINDLSYDQLNKDQKEKIDLFIKKLQDAGLEERILEYTNPPYHYTIFDQTQTFSAKLPDDLRIKIDSIWANLHV